MVSNGPSFMCIGAQKAGTTWLYGNLKQHPQVKLPPMKEIHYFDQIYRGEKTGIFNRIFAKDGMNKWWWKGRIYGSFASAIRRRQIEDFAWFVRYYFFSRDIEGYKKLFNRPTGKIAGDITPDYCILGKNITEMIHGFFPDLRIIYLLRNPVDRAWSALKMRYVKRKGYQLDDLDINLVDDYYHDFWKFNDVQRTLKNWTAYFQRDQFYVGFYDELVEEPRKFYNNILEYLGVGKVGSHENDMLKKKTNPGVVAEIPIRIKKYLCEKNCEQLIFLENYFKQSDVYYPEKWLNEADEVMKK